MSSVIGGMASAKPSSSTSTLMFANWSSAAPIYRSPIRAGSMDRVTLACGNCASRAVAGPCGYSPRRAAILLIGGAKTGDRRFYERMIPIADALYDEHLTELDKEKSDGR